MMTLFMGRGGGMFLLWLCRAELPGLNSHIFLLLFYIYRHPLDATLIPHLSQPDIKGDLFNLT